MAAAQNRQARRRQRRESKAARICPPQAVAPSATLARIPASAPMPGYARFIGRVGALAVALGVGAAVATGYGVPVAHADDTTQSSNDNDKGDGDSGQDNNNNNNNNENENQGDDDGDADDDDDSRDAKGDDTTVGDHEEGDDSQAKLSEDDLDTDDGIGDDEQQEQVGGTLLLQGDPIGGAPAPAKLPVTPTPPVDVAPPAPPADPPPPVPIPEAPKAPIDVIQPAVGDPNADADQHVPVPVPGGGAPLEADTGPSGVDQLLEGATPVEFTVEELGNGAANRVTTFNVEDSQGFSALIAPEPNIIEPEQPDLLAGLATFPSVVARLAYTITAAFLSPLLVGGPTAPAQPPLLWAVLGWVRREFQRTLDNQTPTAVDDPAVTTSEDVAVTISALTNDADTDEDPLTVTDFTQPEHGTVTYDATIKQFTYTPDEDFHGTDTFQYAVSDDGAAPHQHGILGGLYNVGHQDTATVTVTVTPVDDAPVAQDDAATIAEGSSQNIAVLSNDTLSNPNSTINPQTVAITRHPTFGTLTVNSDGTITYQSNGAEVTADSFEYTVDDTLGATSNAAAVTITITPTNDAPVADDETASVDENGSTVIDILTGDSDVDGTIDPSSVLIVQPANGTATLNADGTVTYLSNGADVPTDSFTYTVKDNLGTSSNVATVTITITPANDDPTAKPDDISVGEDSTGYTINPADLLANDTDADNPNSDLTITSLVGNAGGGTITTNGSGGWTYTPPASAQSLAVNETSTETVTYTVSDGAGGTAQGTVKITIVGANDAPTADALVGFLREDQEVPLTDEVLLSFTNDPDTSDTLVITNISDPANGTVIDHGDGTYTYKPDLNFNGQDSFEYSVSDGTTTTTATVTIYLSEVDDPAVLESDSATVAEDSGATTIEVLDNDRDDDGALTIFSVTQPTGGTVTINPGGTSLSYTPDPEYNGGPDSFTYTVSDPDGHVATGSVTVTVTAVPDSSIANDDSLEVAEDSGTTTITVLENDFDPDGPLTITDVTQPVGGTVAITGGGTALTYTPDANFNGGDNTFTYTVSDGTSTATATVTVYVTPVADPTIAGNDAITVTEDSGSTTIDVLANDYDPDGPVYVTSVTQPVGGTVAINPGNLSVRYTPNPNFNGGPNTFTYTATQNGVSTTATVTVTVTAVNDVPVANVDSFTTNEDTGVTRTLPATDADGVGGLTYSLVTNPTRGTITNFNPANGTYTYTPNPAQQGLDTGESAPDSFTYRVNDGTVNSNTATVNITITGVNDAPVTGGDVTITTDENTSITRTLPVGSDVDGETLTYQLVTPATHGTVFNFNGVTGSYLYSPNSAQQGLDTGETRTDSFTYRVNDGTTGSTTSTVYVTITGVNDAPVAVGDSFTTTEDTAVTRTLPAGTDVDGETLTYVLDTNPTHGTISNFNGATGSYTYTPAANYLGPDSFKVRVNDGTVDSANAATVTITITTNDNADDNEISGTITVAGTPTDVVFSPDGTKAYTANANGTISVINTSTRTLIDTNTSTGAVDPITLPVNQIPQAIAVSPNGTRLYVVTRDSNTGAGQMRIYRTDTYTQVATFGVGGNPVDIAVDGTRVYVANNPGTGSGSITVINANTATDNYAIIGSITQQIGQPVALAVSGGRLYVVDADSQTGTTSSVIEYSTTGASNTLPTRIGQVDFSNYDQNGFVVNPATNTGYAVGTVTGGTSYATVALYNLNGTIDFIQGSDIALLGGSPAGLALKGSRLYVAVGDGSTWVVNTTTNAVIDADPNAFGNNAITLPNGVDATDVAISPTGAYAYVSGSDGKLYIVNIIPSV
ncbi:Ig-like domain-containing protein [Mycobacterium sp. NPDC050551]|uniref:beta strand repeat-containing protein n=1 Tax=Mycobacterium sp. NPDC050551 TaxID=3155407 RepID=UPI00342DBA65